MKCLTAADVASPCFKHPVLLVGSALHAAETWAMDMLVIHKQSTQVMPMV
jgi:hypothetical protein